jgi:hypothetical protein
MSIRVDYEGNTYEFSRDTKGNGYWIAVTGRNKYITVPIVLGTALRKKAVEDGIDPTAFHKPKKVRTKSVGVRTKSSRKKKGRFSVSLSSILKSVEKYNKEDNETEE